MSSSPTRERAETPAPTPPRTAAPTHREWARRALSIATTTLLIGVCLLALFTVVIPFTLGAQSYTVLTGSMRPGFEPGTLIAVRGTDPSDIRVGDVITYQLEPGQPEVVTHRVVGINVSASGEPTFITRGDANNVSDALPVIPVQIRGVVVFAVPLLGHLNLFFQGAEKSLLVVAVGIGAIGYGIVVLGRESSRARQRKRQRASAASTVVVLIVASALALGPTAPARADDRTDVPASGVLAVSTDGSTWVRDGSVDLLGAGDPVLVPGKTITTWLWIRNDSSDPAAFALTASWNTPSSAVTADIALDAGLTISFDGNTASREVEWQGHTLAPGHTRSIEVSVALAATSGNDSRRGTVQIFPTVRLTQVVNTAPAPGPSPDGDGDLATTGGTLPLGLSLFAALAVLLGLALATRRRRRRNPEKCRANVGLHDILAGFGRGAARDVARRRRG